MLLSITRLAASGTQMTVCQLLPQHAGRHSTNRSGAKTSNNKDDLPIPSDSPTRETSGRASMHAEVTCIPTVPGEALMRQGIMPPRMSPAPTCRHVWRTNPDWRTKDNTRRPRTAQCQHQEQVPTLCLKIQGGKQQLCLHQNVRCGAMAVAMPLHGRERTSTRTPLFGDMLIVVFSCNGVCPSTNPRVNLWKSLMSAIYNNRHIHCQK